MLKGVLLESVGSWLCAKRKEKGVSLEEIHQKTKIPITSLEAMEADQFDGLGAEAYIKGFLRAYARVLELDPEQVLEKYRASKASQAEEGEVRQAIREIGEQSAREKTRWFSNRIQLLFWGLAIAAAWLVAYLVVGFLTSHYPKETPYYARNFAEARKATGIKDDQVYLLGSAVEDVWLSVQSDDSPSKGFSLKKGDTAVWKARKKFLLNIGNAGGIELQLNDRPLGVLGKHHEVIPVLLIEANGRMHYGTPRGVTENARSK